MREGREPQGARLPAWGFVPSVTWSVLTDLPIFAAGLAVIYAIVALAQYWAGPFAPETVISHSPLALPRYAMYSLLRIAIAYALSLAFTLVYGYVAAYHASAERIMVPLLDVLQSIPVLSFLPGVMLAMVGLFPHYQVGVELGAILLIFTGQVWNMAFSFYSSLKAIPRELREVAQLYGFSKWQRFVQLELPSAALGLIWNSMMSVAGGWFFLMACEMFVLGTRDFRLPGLGSYLQTASGDGDTRAIAWGVATMIGVIVLLDLLVWRPVIAWAQKFKIEQVESGARPESTVLRLLRHSRALQAVSRRLTEPLAEALVLRAARPAVPRTTVPHPLRVWLKRLAGVAIAAAVLVAVAGASRMLAALGWADLRALGASAAVTFLRVTIALLLAAAWTVPVGVWIGFNPRLARVAQPLAQIAASIPATALFPIILLLLVRYGGGLGVGSVVLLLLGTQWYILFNVIAGAMAIPTDLKEASDVYKFGRATKWRRLILPGIFPYLITGLVTAAGGAWNASIVAEYFHFRGRIVSTIGLGATISRATDSGNFALLLAATIVMAAMVVTLNRSIWRPLYRLAETRFKLET